MELASREEPGQQTYRGAGLRPWKNPIPILCYLYLFGGFLASLGDLLNPFFKARFELTYTQAALVQFSHFIAGPVFSLCIGWMILKHGFRRPIKIGIVIFFTGATLMAACSRFGLFPLFLLGIFLCAAGSFWMLTPANPYATLIGPPGQGAARLSLVNGFYAVGATLGPVTLSSLVLRPEVDSSLAIAAPYGVIAAGMALAWVLFALKPLPEPEEIEADEGRPEQVFWPWNYRQVWLGMVGLFVYVGAEVCIPANLVSFLTRADTAGLAPEAAGKWISAYWGLFMAGRFAGAFLFNGISSHRLLRVFAAGALVCLTGSIFMDGWLGAGLMLALGFWHSVLFPSLVALSVRGLGKNTGPATGWLFIAPAGGSFLPLFQGALADAQGLMFSYVVPVAAYVVIFLISLHIPLSAPKQPRKHEI